LEQLGGGHEGNRKPIALKERCVRSSAAISLEDKRDNVGIE
jgi:hypothetical protein